jgi:RNA polymerase sigma-70 factor (ECF subfamily)
MIAPRDGVTDSHKTLERLLVELRPKLHRYCARMTGSVIDGEDVLQEALLKALQALPEVGSIERPESWLLRIAHNTAMDFLRRRARMHISQIDEDLDALAAPETLEARLAAAASLETFMRLPVSQRSTVILMDVLGYSLQEITLINDASLPAVKSALHRGRTRLRELAGEPQDMSPPDLPDADRSLLAIYIDKFNARDFDAVRDLLAAEVRLELVNHVRRSGAAEVGNYFGNYDRKRDWQLLPGMVDGRCAALVCDPQDSSGTPLYFVVLRWSGGRIVEIRDFRYARYVMESTHRVINPGMPLNMPC